LGGGFFSSLLARCILLPCSTIPSSACCRASTVHFDQSFELQRPFQTLRSKFQWRQITV
jgi:hypothetical protein